MKKAAGGSFFSFLVRRRVPKCEAFGSSSSGDAQSAAPSRHSDQKTDADRQGGVGFSIGRDSNPERAKSVKKAAGGSFFSFGETKTESFRRKNN